MKKLKYLISGQIVEISLDEILFFVNSHRMLFDRPFTKRNWKKGLINTHYRYSE